MISPGIWTANRKKWDTAPSLLSSPAADPVKPLRETAIFHKGLFLGGELAVEEAARYRDKCQHPIGRDFRKRGLGGRHGLDGLLPRLALSTRSILSMLSIMHNPRPLCYGVSRGGPPHYEFRPARVLARPKRQPALPEEILIVQPQLFKAGARYVRELEFGFPGRATGLAALVIFDLRLPIYDLFPFSLQHLAFSLPFPRHLKTFQLPVTTMQRDQFFRLIHLSARPRMSMLVILRFLVSHLRFQPSPRFFFRAGQRGRPNPFRASFACRFPVR